MFVSDPSGRPSMIDDKLLATLLDSLQLYKLLIAGRTKLLGLWAAMLPVRCRLILPRRCEPVMRGIRVPCRVLHLLVVRCVRAAIR